MQAKLNASTVNTLEPTDQRYEVWDTEIKGFHLIVHPSGIKTYGYWYRTTDGKKRRYKIGKTTNVTAEVARKEAKLKAADVARGIDVQHAKRATRAEAKKKRQRTLQGFIDAHYGDWLKTERKTGREILDRLKHHFGDWYEKPLTDVNAWLVSNWRTKKLRDSVHPATLNRVVSSLKALMSKAVEWEIIPSNPLASVKPLKIDKTPKTRYLTEDEETRLRTALDNRQEVHREERARYNMWRAARHLEPYPDLLPRQYTDYLKPLVLLALNTGFRQGELFNLRWRDVNLDSKLLTAHGGGTKSGNTRHVPLNKESLHLLQTWSKETQPRPGDVVFPSPATGERLDNIKKAWKGLLELAEIESFRFHDLRHSFASKLVMRGVDLYTVKELLGHSSIEMTQRYAHLAPEHKAAAVAVLDA